MANYLEIEESGRPRRFFQFPGIGAVIGGFSGMMFALHGLIVKFLNRRIDPTVLGFTRAFFMFLSGVFIALLKGHKFWTRTIREYLVLTLSGVLITGSFFCVYISLELINLALALTLISSSSTFVAIINLIFFKTTPNFFGVLQIIGTTIGCVLCAKPQSFISLNRSTDVYVGLGLAVSAGAILAILYVIMAKFTSIETSTVILVQHAVVLVVLGSLILFYEMEVLQADTKQMLLQVAIGLSATFAFLLTILALYVDSALMTSIGRTANIAFGVIFDIVFLGVAFDWMSFCGSVLMLTSIAAPSIVQIISRRNRANPGVELE